MKLLNQNTVTLEEVRKTLTKINFNFSSNKLTKINIPNGLNSLVCSDNNVTLQDLEKTVSSLKK